MAHISTDAILPTVVGGTVEVAGRPAEALRAATGKSVAAEFARSAVSARIGTAAALAGALQNARCPRIGGKAMSSSE